MTAGLRVEGSPTRKTNKQTNTQYIKKIAKDTYTCEQELTQINASEKENKYTGNKEKYSSSETFKVLINYLRRNI